MRISDWSSDVCSSDLGEGGGIDLGGAAGDDDAGVGTFAAQAADRLPGLLLGLGGHRAGIDDDEIVAAEPVQRGADRFAFIAVQPAAETDNGWRRAGCGFGGHRDSPPPQAAADWVQKPGGISPRQASVAGPVMETWLSAAH